ncbi:MAG TPA: hypothetical protein VFQ92_07575 [Blastocatellia bacterium]|nr:hypothetical protein [Blastocatellia bacterium]
MKRERREIDELSREVIKIQASVLAVVCALIGGIGLFTMTAWLLIKDGPNVGAHLRLLGHYLIGYSVSWKGSLVGFFWGMLIGGLIGWTIGKIYNGIAGIRQR